MYERLDHTIGLQQDGCLPGIGDLTVVPRPKTLGKAGR